MLIMLNTELDTFSAQSEIMWKGFVASAIAAVGLQWVNPFGTAKLVLFQGSFHKSQSYFSLTFEQVTFVDDTWRAFELVSLEQLAASPSLTNIVRFRGYS